MDPTSDPKWNELRGGYGIPYDPRPTIAALRADPLNQESWDTLWNELHHQGDVGDASYAAVLLLIDACGSTSRDWNFFGLIATIEVGRHQPHNPPIPQWLLPAYETAMARARELALDDLRTTTDPYVIRSTMAVVALAAGERELGTLLAKIDSSEITEWIQQH